MQPTIGFHVRIFLSDRDVSNFADRNTFLLRLSYMPSSFKARSTSYNRCSCSLHLSHPSHHRIRRDYLGLQAPTGVRRSAWQRLQRTSPRPASTSSSSSSLSTQVPPPLQHQCQNSDRTREICSHTDHPSHRPHLDKTHPNNAPNPPSPPNSPSPTQTPNPFPRQTSPTQYFPLPSLPPSFRPFPQFHPFPLLSLNH